MRRVKTSGSKEKLRKKIKWPHNGRIWIEKIFPSVDGGRFPVKRIVGDLVKIQATIFRDGHDPIKAVVKWKNFQDQSDHEIPMVCIHEGLDSWEAEIPLESIGITQFRIEAWSDVFLAWAEDFKKRVNAGMTEISSEKLEGLKILSELKNLTNGSEGHLLEEAVGLLKDIKTEASLLVEKLFHPDFLKAVFHTQPRQDFAQTQSFSVISDPPLARFGSWYEFFVRSQGSIPGKSGTFQDATRRLSDIQDLGFDVVYLAPIHPIGKSHRKGKNNSLTAGPNDPGSPWAIGNENGGHMAIEPSLGTFTDFDDFIKEADRLGLAVALDFAIQASPDHPWVKKHPEWFYQRPDGSIKFAENPPKKYQDIYPINFDTPNQKALWNEMRKILFFWISRGVKIFRVDNPHTKPLPFWKWLIEEVKSKHPEIIFLSEAFTRPAPMKALAKAGFSQSYTYFTWRNTKEEFTKYLTELTQTEMQEYYRPNFFATTPDILPPGLQTGEPAAFKIRFVLAATLSGSYGIYSGFELCEAEAIPGKEEYLNSEKYEIKIRDWTGSKGNIRDWVKKINQIRKDYFCLHDFKNIQFLKSDNDQILFYVKTTSDGNSPLLIAVNLDPLHAQEAMVKVPAEVIGLKEGESFQVRDLLSDAVYEWTERNYVRLDPQLQPAHILAVERR